MVAARRVVAFQRSITRTLRGTEVRYDTNLKRPTDPGRSSSSTTMCPPRRAICTTTPARPAAGAAVRMPGAFTRTTARPSLMSGSVASTWFPRPVSRPPRKWTTTRTEAGRSTIRIVPAVSAAAAGRGAQSAANARTTATRTTGHRGARRARVMGRRSYNPRAASTRPCVGDFARGAVIAR